MGVRNRCRRTLLQARFAARVNGMSLARNIEALRKMLDHPEPGLGAPLEPGDWAWIASLGEAVEASLDEIRKRIDDSLENWSMDRLSLVTGLVLEQAVGEMMFLDPPTPVPVVIDEAVELGRKFDSEDAAGLINGVLDTIAREIAPGSDRRR